MPIRSIIIDDDAFILKMLQDKLRHYIPEVEVVATAGSGREGLKAIKQYQPDLIFLDVEMRDMTGFDMLSELPEIAFQTIFITSFSHYAIKAIRFNALDYILKPIDLIELRQAVKRYKKKFSPEKHNEHIQEAIKNLNTNDPGEQTLILHLQEGEQRIPLKNIIKIEGERNYSFVHLINKRKKLCAKILKEFEEVLSDKGFFRCHRSYLINRLHIEKLAHRYQVICSDQSEVPISRRKADSFGEWYRQQMAG
jgi:two-component system LytT family response regulator